MVIRYVTDLQNVGLPVQVTKFSDFCLEWNSRETRFQLEIDPTQAKSIIVWAVILADRFFSLARVLFHQLDKFFQ